MDRKQKTTSPRIVVAVRLHPGTVERLRAVATRRGERLSDVMRSVLDRAARRAA